MAAADRPRLAVVIPTFDSGDWIFDTVTSVRSAADAAARNDRVAIASAVLVVVDDGSAVAIEALLDGALGEADIVVLTARNRGQHAATLTGIETAVRAGAACIVTVDDDLLFGPGALADLLCASGWGTEASSSAGLAYGVVRQGGTVRAAVSRAARLLIRWRPEWIATSIRSIPAAWCSGLDDRPIDTQLLATGRDPSGVTKPAVRVPFESCVHPSAHSRYGIVALLRHAGHFVRSWLSAHRQ